MNGSAPRRGRAAEFARLADLAVDRPGADVAKQLATDEEAAALVTLTQALRELDLDAGPDPEFRDRLRQRVIAHASVTTPAKAGAARPRPVVPAPRGGRAQRLAKTGSPRLAFLAGALAALVMISGLTLLASSRAVPGDTLYAIKRSSENLELALAHGPADRGNRQLGFAWERLLEIGKLVARNGNELGPATSTTGSGTLGSPDTDRMLDVLQDMDGATGEGVAIITGLAVEQRSQSMLNQLESWTTKQRGTLLALKPHMPAVATQRADDSLNLLNNIVSRIAGLRQVLNCTCMQNAKPDPLGPVPCPVPCTPQSAVPGGGPGASSAPAGPTSGPGGSSPDPVQTSGGTSPPSGSAPPPPSTAGPNGSTSGPVGVGTNAPLPTASGQPPPSPDLVCRLLDKVLCKH
jgi:hypothetical protein